MQYSGQKCNKTGFWGTFFGDFMAKHLLISSNLIQIKANNIEFEIHLLLGIVGYFTSRRDFVEMLRRVAKRRTGLEQLMENGLVEKLHISVCLYQNYMLHIWRALF